MSILETIILSQIFMVNEMLTTNKVNIIKDTNKLMRKYRKLLKIEKLSKSLKLFKLRNLKDEKLFKSQKSAKLRKKLLKSGNSSNFNAKKDEPSF